MSQNAGAAASGNPFAEQRALAAGRAVAILDRGIVTVSGPDRLTWLDSLTSQRLVGLAVGESAETLLLDPTGRIEHAIRVVDDGETAWLLVDDAPAAAALAAWLERMRFLLRVEVADRSADFAVVGHVPPRSLSEPAGSAERRSLSEPAGSAERRSLSEPAGRVEGSITWHDPWGTGIRPGGWQYSTAPDHPAADWSWAETVVDRDRIGELGETVPAAAAEALRVAAWRPAFSREVDERSIPHELDWLRSAVHLEKGCYRGQETVAKVHNLGHPPRRLVFLHVDGSDHELPEHGDDVVLAGTDDVVGRVTSGANHWELGPIALAVVKRSVDPAAGLEVLHRGEHVDGSEAHVARLAAAQEVIVPQTAGATADIPRIPRLGAVRR